MKLYTGICDEMISQVELLNLKVTVYEKKARSCILNIFNIFLSVVYFNFKNYFFIHIEVYDTFNFPPLVSWMKSRNFCILPCTIELFKPTSVNVVKKKLSIGRR